MQDALVYTNFSFDNERFYDFLKISVPLAGIMFFIHAGVMPI